MNVVGKYFRKKGVSGNYNPNHGWDRKWTHKVGFNAGTGKLHLVAMTDGMITKEKSHKDILDWIEKEGMVQMTKSEVISFFDYEICNF